MLCASLFFSRSIERVSDAEYSKFSVGIEIHIKTTADSKPLNPTRQAIATEQTNLSYALNLLLDNYFSAIGLGQFTVLNSFSAEVNALLRTYVGDLEALAQHSNLAAETLIISDLQTSTPLPAPQPR